MSKRVEDFMESQRRAGRAWMDGKTIKSDALTLEDIELVMSFIGSTQEMLVLSLLGTEGAICWGFALGVMWSQFKAQCDSPINEMLKDVDI